MKTTNHSFIKAFISTAALLLLCQCTYWEQLQEERRLDAEYDTYYAAHVPESKSLTALKSAARRATAARVKKMYASDKADEYISFSPEELSELKLLMESLQELPPVEREAWKNEQRKGVHLPSPMPFYLYFSDLELLDADGKVLGTLSLTGGIASTEEAEAYRNTADRSFKPDYMLSPDELKRFRALPPVEKGGY
ncbi:MAG: hypothetical protein IKZ13_07585 [Akkermansia sp.]|nr:hypothetical protein [Akkermansia sp.]